MVEKPIFFIGMGRSGTTIIYEAFSCQEDLGWLSNYTRRFPMMPQITAVHRLFQGARGEKSQYQKLSLANRFLPKPTEAVPVWERLLGTKFLFGFLRDTNPTTLEIEKTRKYVRRIITAQGKKRFCAKFTGPPRIRFLTKIFPDAYFVDVIRDPCAVVASLISVGFWKNKGGLQGPFWQGGLDDEAMALWEKSGRSPVVLAALQWRAICEATAEEKDECDVRYYVVRYEQFVEDPLATMNDILCFCGLGESQKVNNYIGSRIYKNMNYKFRHKLTRKDILQIHRIAGKQMGLMGYM